MSLFLCIFCLNAVAWRKSWRECSPTLAASSMACVTTFPSSWDTTWTIFFSSCRTFERFHNALHYVLSLSRTELVTAGRPNKQILSLGEAQRQQNKTSLMIRRRSLSPVLISPADAFYTQSISLIICTLCRGYITMQWFHLASRVCSA